MDEGEWTEVKAKKPKRKPKPEEQKSAFTGGKNKKGMLISGAVQQSHTRVGGGDEWGTFQTSNAAQHIADVVDDYGDEDFYAANQNIELVSNVCAQAVSEARLAAKMTQVDLAKKIGEKTSVVVDIENATAPYNAQQITNIEKALNVKIARGRKKHRGGKR